MRAYEKSNDQLKRNEEKKSKKKSRTEGPAAIILAISLLVTPLSAFATTEVEEAYTSITPLELVGAEAAKADESWTLQDMLLYAIQDEYLAQAEYEAIMDEYGIQRPFSNIIRAEQTHIDLLLPLFAAHGIPVPENDAAARTVIPVSLAESYTIGVSAEKENIAMFASFLMEELPDDVRVAFERLMNASISHQRAFERAAGRTEGVTASRGRNDFRRQRPMSRAMP